MSKEQPLEQQLGLRYGVKNFTMTDVQKNGMVTVGFSRDDEYKTIEIDKETAIMVFAAFEGGKDWLREEMRLLLNVQEKTWRSG